MYVNNSLYFRYSYFSYRIIQFRDISINIGCKKNTSGTTFLIGRSPNWTYGSLSFIYIPQNSQYTLVTLRIGKNIINITTGFNINKLSWLKTAISVNSLITDICWIDHIIICIHINELDCKPFTLFTIELRPKSLSERFKDFTSGAS